MITENDFRLAIKEHYYSDGLNVAGATQSCYQLAKKMAMEFTNWTNSPKSICHANWGHNKFMDEDGDEISTEEVFNIYIKEQTK